ncbi:MAG: branched-chain amino acid ABC transporter permease [Nitrospinota bacterium]
MGTAGRLAWVGAAVVAVLAPLFLDVFWTSLLIQILVFGLLALSVDLLLGHTGLFPLGHAAIFAVAAYTTAILEARHAFPTLLAAPAGVVAAVILAAVFGLGVRTGGVYFILVTLAMGYIVWGVSLRWASFTGGDNGVGNVPLPALGSLSITGLSSYYYVVLIVVAVCAMGYHLLVRSPFGLALRGIRESESRMRALGYNVVAHKFAAFLLSGLFAGVAGVLYVYWNRFVSPATAHFLVSAEAALMVILGGAGTILGPFIGSAIILGIRNYVSAYLVQWMTVMGLVFIVTVLWAPHGLLGLLRRFRARSRTARPERGLGVAAARD